MRVGGKVGKNFLLVKISAYTVTCVYQYTHVSISLLHNKHLS